MSQLFLSYSSKDRKIGLQVKTALEAKGHKVWFDQDQIAGGDYYADRIPKGIRNSKIFLIIVTSNSVGDGRIGKQGSKEVATEVGLAKDSGCKIIPLKADTTPPGAFDDAFQYQLRNHQWIDIGAAIALNDFGPIVDEVIRIFSGTVSVNLEANYLKEVEKALKDSQPEEALQRLSQYHFKEANINEIEFLKVTANLLKYPLVTMSKKQADHFVVRYRSLLQTDMAVPSAYILGILSRYYYQANSIADLTGGFVQLKAQAKNKERLKAKYKLMAEHLLPTVNQYALDWQL